MKNNKEQLNGSKGNVEQFIIAIGIPILVGSLSGVLVGDSMIAFQNLEKPTWAPQGWIFPIVWSALYVMMGVASYLIFISNKGNEKGKPFRLYGIQLIFNFFWSIIFFGGEWYLLALLWLVILWIFIVLTIREFYQISKGAAYLLLPYIIWVTFAGILNLAIYLLN